LLPSVSGPSAALLIVEDPHRAWDFADAPRLLKGGTFEVEKQPTQQIADALCLGWSLGCYRYATFKKRAPTYPQLVWPQNAIQADVLALSEGICLGRDLVNAPANHMGPVELSDAAKSLAESHAATFRSVVGDALLKKNYPMIHAVGRASAQAPRLLDLAWGKASDPKVTLVGKGVCFDTGGLDVKPAAFMKLMKKDMGGAALVLGLAHAIMSQKLPIRLRVLIPAVENSISGNAMRPLDVLRSRKGISVEVGDTDAEGRLVLADALTEALSEKPDLLIDAATLTGAARVALGTSMPAIFSIKDSTWKELEEASAEVDDPLWRLPLHAPYRSKLSSKIADISNIGSDGYAGAIVAALFLREFVNDGQDWVHMDTMGYNLESRPGRPAGGETLGLLALHRMLKARYPARLIKKAKVVRMRSTSTAPQRKTRSRRVSKNAAARKVSRSA
jgi:leucyl aminopeptidase